MAIYRDNDGHLTMFPPHGHAGYYIDRLSTIYCEVCADKLPKSAKVRFVVNEYGYVECQGCYELLYGDEQETTI